MIEAILTLVGFFFIMGVGYVTRMIQERPMRKKHDIRDLMEKLALFLLLESILVYVFWSTYNFQQ